jgi:hypothetical protein
MRDWLFILKQKQESASLRVVFADDLLGDGAVGLLYDSVDMLRCLDWVRLFVDPLELLESTALGLNTGGMFSKLLFPSVHA